MDAQSSSAPSCAMSTDQGPEPAAPAGLDTDVESVRSTGNMVTIPSAGCATHPVPSFWATPRILPVTFADENLVLGVVMSHMPTGPAPEPATTTIFFAA